MDVSAQAHTILLTTIGYNNCTSIPLAPDLYPLHPLTDNIRQIFPPLLMVPIDTAKHSLSTPKSSDPIAIVQAVFLAAVT